MFKSNEKLSYHSHYRIGGEADFFYEARTVDALIRAIEKAHEKNLPIFTLGGGTNILFRDEGYRGLVIKPTMNKVVCKGNMIIVGAGATVEQLLEVALEKKLSGLEWAGGLPGSIGGGVRGNAGAFGGEMKDVLVEVVSVDISTKKPMIRKRTGKQCAFGYRTSVFKEKGDKEIIIQATYMLKPGSKKEIRDAIESKIEWRRSRQPLDYPNVGSIFKNVDVNKVPNKWRTNDLFKNHLKIDPFPVIPAAFLIHQVDLKGVSFGGAMISPKHPNFIVNVLSAQSTDVLALMRLVKHAVKKKFNIDLEEEVMIV